MPEHPHYAEDAIVNPETHHEKSDVSVRAILWFVVACVVFGFVLHITIWLMYRGLVHFENRRNTSIITEMQRPADMSVPQNQPLLQPFPTRGLPQKNTPVTDLKDMREAEQKALTTYGWVDEKKGTVRIPIEQAKQLVLRQGLPVRTTTTTTTTPATTTAGGQP